MARTAQGGTIVGPRADAKDLQTVDVRDLCPWMVTLIERDVSGIFNAAAPRVSWDRVLHELSPLSQQSVRVVRPPAPVIEELKQYRREGVTLVFTTNGRTPISGFSPASGV